MADSPLLPIKLWVEKLPSRIKGMIAQSWIISLPNASLDEAAALTDKEQLAQMMAWLDDGQENPFSVVGKAIFFRGIMEHYIEPDMSQEGWDERRKFIEGFEEKMGPTESSTRQLREQDFHAALWKAQKESWDAIKADHLSDEALKVYRRQACLEDLD